METNGVESHPVEITEYHTFQFRPMDVTDLPGKKEQMNFNQERYKNTSMENNLEEELSDLPESKWRQNVRMNVVSKYRIGGSVESIFSQVSSQGPGWTMLKSSKLQDAIGCNSSFIQTLKLPSKQKSLEIIDDVVGDEMNFKLCRRQLHEKNIYRPISHNCLVPFKMSASEFLPDGTSTESKAYHWNKDTELNQILSEETGSDHSQVAESEGHQDISLLKSNLMEFKINEKEIRRVQTADLNLMEEMQSVLLENERLRRELEAVTSEREQKQEDLLNSFDLSSSFQKQILTLKHQINDLQEANESAVLELSKADEEISQQRKDMAKLKAEYSQKLEDSQEEMNILTEKISQISSSVSQPEIYQEDIHKEITQLRSECRRLRAQNHLLSEENHHLKEVMWDLKMQHHHYLAGEINGPGAETNRTANLFTGPLVETLHSNSWCTEDSRKDAFNDDGTFSKCKAALGSVNIKGLWESGNEELVTRNSSPFSMDSENTEFLIMASEDNFHKASHMHNSGGACEEKQELSDDLSSVSQIRDHSLPIYSHSTKASLLHGSPSKTAVSRRSNLSVLPRRPFAPNSVAELKLGDLVKFSRPGGKISKGTIQYKGCLPGRQEIYVGVELEGDELGKHDGIFQGVRYFVCKPNKGVFVNFSKIIMAWN